MDKLFDWKKLRENFGRWNGILGDWYLFGIVEVIGEKHFVNCASFDLWRDGEFLFWEMKDGYWLCELKMIENTDGGNNFMM